MRADNGLISGVDEISDAVDGGAVEVAAVLAVLDELPGLDVDLHLLAALEEVILAVDLAWTALPRRVWRKDK